MYEIIICSNAETICDGYSDERTEAWKSEIALAYAGAAVEVVNDARRDYEDREVGKDREVDYDTCANFSKWHGGIHAKVGATYGGKTYGYSAGWVVTHSVDPPQWVKDLIDKAAQAGSNARNEAVKEYEAIDAA